ELAHSGGQLRRRVVEHDPAEAFQHLRGRAAAGPGQPGDHGHLDTALRLLSPRHDSPSLVVFSAASTARAVLGPTPGTSVSSASLACWMRRTEPKCLSSAVRRVCPSPVTSSNAELVMRAERFCRW